MRYEFDACVIKEWKTRSVVFRGLLLGGDPRTTLFLTQVQQEVRTLRGASKFTVLRYPSGCEARGSWITDRFPKKAAVRSYSKGETVSYLVTEDGELVTAFEVSADIDLVPYVFSYLLDYGGPVFHAVGQLSQPVRLEGFPDSSKHPDTF